MLAGLLIALAVNAAPLPAARGDFATAQAQLGEVHGRVASQQAQLDALSAKIAADKSKQSGKLFVPGALEQELAQSQALADQLAQSRALEAQRAQVAEAARDALYRSLSAEIDARKPNARDPRSLAELQKLQSERDAVAPKSGAAISQPAFTGSADDRRALRERADALRDQADKLAKQQQALAARIQAARDQAQLEKQLSRLSGSDSLFDESDRRVRISRTDSPSMPAAVDRPTASMVTGTGPSKSTSVSTAGAVTSATPHTQSDSASLNNGPTFSAGTQAGPAPTAEAATSPSAMAAPGASEIPATHSGELVRPDELGRGSSASSSGEDDSLGSLLRQQEQLARQHAALEQQAAALDAQAK